MRYELQIKQPLQFFVGDQPDAEMQIKKTDINGIKTPASGLLGATARWTKGSGYLYPEILMTTSGDGIFTFKANSKVTNEVDGAVLARIYEDSGVVATIDSNISAVDTSVAITVVSGTMPATGFYKINDEWGEYTYTGVTVTFTVRGRLSTNAASHTSGDTIQFSPTAETAQPHYQYNVSRDENAL